VGWFGVVALAWAIVLSIVGGFDTRVLGLKMRARDPYNALILAALALGIYALYALSLYVRRKRARPRY
jgi:hypothetical protein